MKKKNVFFVMFSVILFLSSCKSDDAPVCTTCSSSLTTAFELCKESNGNASVNGENTGVAYDVYLQGLLDEGAQCN